MNTTIDSYSTAFQGSLNLKEINNWDRVLARSVLNNKVLKKLAEQQKGDIFVSQSAIIAPTSRRAHYAGDILYKLFITKEDNSFLGKVKHFFGFDKVALSKRFHTSSTIEQYILPNLSLKKLAKRL